MDKRYACPSGIPKGVLCEEFHGAGKKFTDRGGFSSLVDELLVLRQQFRESKK